ncbi:MAG: PD40 domain-containing protein [Spirochaetes bacterium]|nr:PD40 domain-containing protein [Spirochaetota bacterium]
MKATRAILVPILLTLCIASCAGESDSPNYYSELASPERIIILGYGGDAMEPFISRDGKYLFFNDNVTGSPEKNIHFATRISDAIFQYHGPLAAVNSTEVDGVPTLDSGNRLYFLSIVNYAAPEYYTLYRGTWTGSTVTGIAPLSGLTIPTSLVFYFDIDISPDGETAYLSRGDFTGGSPPSSADLVIATASGSAFSVDPDSDSIMANVNTAGLEYAPAISENGRELFFTRFDPLFSTPRIYRSTRNSSSGAFGIPQLVINIEGFVEGPAFSPNERSIYYHRLNTLSGLFEIYRVTR